MAIREVVIFGWTSGQRVSFPKSPNVIGVVACGLKPCRENPPAGVSFFSVILASMMTSITLV